MGPQAKDIFISELKVKDAVDSIFLVKYLALMEGRDGRNYLNMVVSDSSGEIECRLWSKVHEVNEAVQRGNFVKIKGKVNLYQGRKQLVIQEIFVIPSDQINEKDFIFKSFRSPEEMYSRLLEIVSQMDDVYIRDLINIMLDDSEIKRRLLLWPAGKSIHHAYQSGLLEHILSCAELSLIMSRHYMVNSNYVVAGAILHDLGKIYELSDGFVVDYTEEGKLVGHMAKVLELLDRFTYRIKNFPYSTKIHLKHIILAHHGEYEYGSPKIPQTSEALLVHLIDFLDSKMNAVETIKKNDTTPGHWSAFVKHLDRIIFKGHLPHFTDYIPTREESAEEEIPLKREEKVEKMESKNKGQHHHKGPKELKQNLGKLLQGFKVET